MNKIFTIHFHSKFDIFKLKTPLIIVVGIALKDRVDLISIMVPLEVIAKNINIIFVCACIIRNIWQQNGPKI